MRIYGLVAEKRSGKDTFANFAVLNLPVLRVEKRHLAVPLKEFCQEYLGLTHEQCHGEDEIRNLPVGTWGDYFPKRLSDHFEQHVDAKISARQILQVVGTEIFRANFKPTFWIDLLLKREIPRAVERGVDVLFVPDVRFLDEVQGLRGAGAKIIRIYRDIERSGGCSGHASEEEMKTIPGSEFDYVVTPAQNTTMMRLELTVKEILRAEGLLA